MGHAKELMRIAAVARVGRAGQYVLGGRVVQRVIKPRDAARSVAECRMGGDVGNAVAVDVNLAAIAQAFKVFLTGERPVGGAHVILSLGPTRRRAHGYPPRSVAALTLLLGARASRRTSTRATPVPGCTVQCGGDARVPRGRGGWRSRSGGSLARRGGRQKIRNRVFLEQFPYRVAAP